MGKGNKNPPVRLSNTTPDEIELKKVRTEEVIPEYSKSTQLTVFFIMVIISHVIGYFVLHEVLNKTWKCLIVSKSASIEQVFPQLIIFMSLLLVLQTGMAEWMEMVSNKIHNDIYRCHRNLINSHILWTAIFCGLLLWDLQALYDTEILVALVDIFCIGRAYFAFGYMIGTILGFQSLRAPGLALNIGSICCVASILFKFKFGEYFL